MKAYLMGLTSAAIEQKRAADEEVKKLRHEQFVKDSNILITEEWFREKFSNIIVPVLEDAAKRCNKFSVIQSHMIGMSLAQLSNPTNMQIIKRVAKDNDLDCDLHYIPDNTDDPRIWVSRFKLDGIIFKW